MKSLEELRALREKMKSQTDNRSVAGADETVIKVSTRFWTKRKNVSCTTSAFRRRAASACAVWNPSSKYSKTDRNIRMYI